MDYIYRGDRLTTEELRGKKCNAIRQDGKCIRSRMATMLVRFESGIAHVVLARQLRKIK